VNHCLLICGCHGDQCPTRAIHCQLSPNEEAVHSAVLVVGVLEISIVTKNLVHERNDRICSCLLAPTYGCLPSIDNSRCAKKRTASKFCRYELR
jgi:hypothetical protein